MATTNQSLTLSVSADSWQGDPQFIVMVDGKQVGDVQTATASHAAGQWQDVTLTGNFSSNPSSVSVNFLNDAYAGTAATDRNLYVQSLTLAGQTYLGSAVRNTLGPARSDSAALYSAGTLTFATGAPVVTQNSLTLRVAADSWQGNPQFIVMVDGKQVGGVQTASASHAAGQWQDITLTGSFGSNPSNVAITFINDAYAGSAATDRNLYVQSLTIAGQTYLGSALQNTLGPARSDSAAVYSAGTLTFATGTQSTAPTATPTPAPNSLTLRVAADSWQGDPQFTVMVDGKQVGGVQTASASHAAGQWQDITLTGNFGSNPSNVAITFINDAYAGTAATDRNLYVQSLTIAGQTYLGSTLQNPLGPARSDSAALYSAGTLTFATGAPTAGAPSAAPLTAPVIADFASRPTTDNTPTISGTAAGGSRVAISLDGSATPLAVVSADANGAWSYTPTAALSDGTHSMSARTIDAAGNASASSAVKAMTIDTTPPSERVTSITVGANGVIDATQGSPKTVTVSGTLSAGLAAGDTVAVTLGGSTYTVAANNVQGTNFTLSAAAPSAGWVAGSATAHVEDQAGNQNASLTQAFSVLTAPKSSAPATTPTPTGHLGLLGVNLSGGEYAGDKLPGIVGTNYTYPDHGELDYYASKGMNVIRLPFLWERVQQSQNGPLSQKELSLLDDVVNYANSKGMKVVLDPHNYGNAFGNQIGSAGTPTSSFADFWGKLAGHYASNNNVLFGLMNEPQQPTAKSWLTDVNAAIASIRQSGATSQEILVPGAYYDCAWTWTTTDNASVIGAGVRDPAHNFVFEVHQYLDFDGSGTHTSVVSPTAGADRLSAITQWAKNTGNKLFLGEFGVAKDQASVNALDNMLGYMNQHSDIWQGGTAWSGGPWLGDNIFTIEPTGLGSGKVTDSPQMGVLQHYAPGTA